ncbi:acyl-CoA dehydrogenase family protein [Mesorhizobium sp. J428]|uniref:acyl-CoA dehydrogenase family protein n=1 Tax=Mesorhizobium sp. J428 TaxID=2898440 RepID=UPI002150CE20|nr:acyl-CoA dehydrogenase [Mesorhizobium sp. J428]
MEEAGYQWMALRGTLNTINIVASILGNWGSEAQKETYLRPLLAGKRRVFVAITEPNHGSNVAGLETRAEARGGAWLLNGSKLWITNGLWGEFGIVVAKTYSNSCDGGISLFLIDRQQSSYTAERVKTMVVRATGTSALTFADTVVPHENLIGREGEGLKMILTGLNFGRLSVAMGAVGAGQAALDLSTTYAQTRQQFGRPIGGFQLVQKHIVDMTVRVEAARMLGYRAAWALDAGLPARQECSIAKLYATEAAHEVADMALQVHGGMGYSADYPIERIFRDTRGSVIPEGTSEIQTLIVGREILGISAIA